MRTVSTSECNSFEEVRKLFERAFGEIDEINFVIAPTREERVKKIAIADAKARKEAEAKARAKAIADAEAIELAKARAVIAQAEVAKEAEKASADEKAKTLAEAKKVIAAAKKKGFITMKLLVFIVLFVSLFVGVVHGYTTTDINYSNVSNPETLQRLLRDLFANQTADSYTFTPRSTAPQTAEGKVYYDSGAQKLQLYDGTSWVTLDVAGGVNLDGAYDFSSPGGGRTISVTNGRLEFTATEGADNIVMKLVQADTDSSKSALQITHAGGSSSYIALDIDGQSSGRDIEGTGADFYVEGDGSIVGLDLDLTGTGGIKLKYDETITNTVDTEIMFKDSAGNNELIFDMDAGGAKIELKSGDVTELGFGVVDDLTGIGTIAFDAAASTITLAASGDSQNLTIQVTNSHDSSLILNSAGTAVDAMILNSTAGGIDIDALDDINITVTSSTGSEDVLITQTGGTNSGIILTSSGTGDSAIKLETTNSAGDIWIDSGDDLVIDVAGLVDIDIIGDFDIDSDAGINITSAEASNGAITLTTTDNAGQIVITSADTTIDGIDINSSGGIDIDTALTVAIDISGSASDFDVDAGSGSVHLDGGEADQAAIKLDASATGGGMDFDAGTLGIDVDTTGPIVLTSTENTADSIVIQSTVGGIDILCDAATSEDIDILNTGGSIIIKSTESAVDSIVIESTLGGIDILASGATNEDIDIINTGGAVNIKSTESTDLAIHIETTSTSGQIQITSTDTSDDGIEIDADGGIEIDAAKSIVITSSEGSADSIQITSTAGGIDILCDTTDSGSEDLDIGLSGSTNSSIDITSAGTGVDSLILESTGGGIDINAKEVITIDLTGGTVSTSDIRITNAQGTDDGAIELTATAGGIDLNAAKSIVLTSTENSPDSIVIQSTLGGIDIKCDASDTEAIDISNAGGPVNISSTYDQDDSILISTSNAAGQILISSADTSLDGFEITAAGGLIITSGLTTSSWTHTPNGTEDDLTISVAGSVDSSLILQSSGSGIDSITIKTITNGGDILITSADNIDIGSNASAQDITIGNVTDASSLALKMGTGNFTLEGVAASTITIGLAAQTGTIKLGESSSTGQVDVGTGTGAHTLNLATGGTGAKTINIGDGADVGITTIKSGTGDLILQSTDAIKIGENAVQQLISIGNVTSGSSLTLEAGTGNHVMTGVVGTTYTIGNAAQTGTMKFGESSASMQLDLGTGTGAHTIHIGDGGTNTQAVTVGSTSSASALTLQAGTGNHVMTGVAATTYTIGNSSQTGTMKFGESDATMILNLGTGVGAHAIHIGDGGTAAQVVTIGSTSDASALTLQAGSGEITITGKPTVSGISVFTAGAQSASVALEAQVEANQTTIVQGTRFVTVTVANDINDVVILPYPAVVGNIIRITVPAVGCELQTDVGGADTINTVDCSGANELALTAAYIYEATCVAANTWIVNAWDDVGASISPLTPSAD